MDFMTLITPIIKTLILAAVFFVWFIRYDNIVLEFKKYNYSPKLRDLVGILKITSVILIQSESVFSVKVGTATLAFLMLAAFGTHIKTKNPLIEMVPSFILMVLSVFLFVTC